MQEYKFKLFTRAQGFTIMIEEKEAIEKKCDFASFFFTFCVFFGIIYVPLWRAHKRIFGCDGETNVTFQP
jgi:hypothetical protein